MRPEIGRKVRCKLDWRSDTCASLFRQRDDFAYLRYGPPPDLTIWETIKGNYVAKNAGGEHATNEMY